MSRPIQEYAVMPGIRDLVGPVKMYFAMAVKHEDEGDVTKANEYLAKALDAEAKRSV